MNDQLANALAEAIKAGSQLAYPALIGYFITKFFTDFLIYPLTWTIVIYGVSKLINLVFNRFEAAEKAADERRRR